ncbi:serine/threonine protein kinase, partial [Streptomyces viridosporus ATCC 14672]
MSRVLRCTPLGGDGALRLRDIPEGPAAPSGFLRVVLPRHRLLHQGQHPVRHEAGRPHDDPGSGDFAHFHHPPADRRLHPAPGPARHHLVRARRVPRVHDYLHAVTLHAINPPPVSGGWDRPPRDPDRLTRSLTTFQVSHPALTIDRPERARPLRAGGRGNVSCGSAQDRAAGMNMAMMRLRREDPRVVGSFRLHRRLGAGGMGVVYLGSDKKGQRVALKVIRPDLAEDQEFRSRFAREVSAARRIRGGCTARLVAADLDADRPWFATQYVPGPSLHDKVAGEGPLGAAEVAAIGAALSEGLVAVHEAGVVHRDLKPSNILLSPKGPRIIDFGIAWATGASTLTHVGTAVGSPGFLAPEQVRGAAVTPATDVFSLGATLAYASMGDSPFGHGSSEVMLYRVVHEEAQLHGVPDALAPLVRACLAKDPEERPSTLQLSLRLKEIAAREAQGLADVRPPAPREA